MNFNFEIKLLKEILEHGLKPNLANIYAIATVALRAFSFLHGSIVSNKSSFSLLKQMKNYFCSTMEKER